MLKNYKKWNFKKNLTSARNVFGSEYGELTVLRREFKSIGKTIENINRIFMISIVLNALLVGFVNLYFVILYPVFFGLWYLTSFDNIFNKCKHSSKNNTGVNYCLKNDRAYFDRYCKYQECPLLKGVQEGNHGDRAYINHIECKIKERKLRGTREKKW